MKWSFPLVYVCPYCQFGHEWRTRVFYTQVYTACIVSYVKEATNNCEMPSRPSKQIGNLWLKWFVIHSNLSLQITHPSPLPVWSWAQGFSLWISVSDRLSGYFKLSASVALKLFFCPFHIQLHPFTSPHTVGSGTLVPSILIALLAKHHGIVISLTWKPMEGLCFYATLLKTIWWELKQAGVVMSSFLNPKERWLLRGLDVTPTQ